jgi:hypothetical protein
MSESLNETIARAAEHWTPEDITAIVEGLRTLRSAFNVEQSKGSRKLVRTASIEGAKKKPTPFSGLSGIVI